MFSPKDTLLLLRQLHKKTPFSTYLLRNTPAHVQSITYKDMVLYYSHNNFQNGVDYAAK